MNLVELRVDDAAAEGAHVRARAVGRRPAGHHDRLRVVMDHPRHEGDVRGGVRSSHAVGARLRDRGGIGMDRRERLCSGSRAERRDE